MKDRGKAVEIYNSEFLQDYSCASDLPCKKHPQSSSVGICAYCLKDRLVKLVCSDCGEQRLSSCSCSEISPNRNSSVEVGSVGRVSFLIENDKKDEIISSINNNSKPKSEGEKPDGVFLLKRSNSTCVEIKKKNGLWKIGRFFRRKKDKDCAKSSVGGFDDKSDLWVVDQMGVSRSRSLCSFRTGGGFFGSEDGGDGMSYSGARSSISAARSSGVNGGLLFDPERRSGFSESEPRKSGFDSDRRDSTVAESEFGSDFRSGMKKSSFMDVDSGGGGAAVGNGANRRVFSLRESYFTGGEDSGFIDLKFEFPSESRGDHNHHHHHQLVNSAFGSKRVGGGGDFAARDPYDGGSVFGDGMLSHGGSCRITVSERGIRKSRKSFKGWRWIFRRHPSWISGRKKDEDITVNNNIK